MISLKEGHGTKICDFFEGGTRKAVYFHQTIDPQYQNVIDDVEPVLKDHAFREKFDLSLQEIDRLMGYLKDEEVPEDSKMRKKYFRVKREIHALSLSEMNIEDTNDFFQINVPHTKEYAGTWQLTSSSGGGKTTFLANLVERQWESPKTKRRPLLMISSEESIDKSLDRLKRKRYKDLYIGLDVSTQAYEDWKEREGGSPEDWFKQMILPEIRKLEPNSMVAADDTEDSIGHPFIHKVLETLMRTGRHRHISPLFMINHRILSGVYGRQLRSSVKWRVLFPRSSKHKITMWLNTHLSMPLPEARHLVNKILPHSRWMAIHLHSPVCVVSQKYIKLL